MKPRRVVEIFLAVGVFAFIAGVVDRGVVLASGSDHRYELWSTGGAISAILLGVGWAMLALIALALLTLLCVAVAKVFRRLRPSREATTVPGGNNSAMSAARAATLLSAVILVLASPVILLTAFAVYTDWPRYAVTSSSVSPDGRFRVDNETASTFDRSYRRIRLVRVGSDRDDRFFCEGAGGDLVGTFVANDAFVITFPDYVGRSPTPGVFSERVRFDPNDIGRAEVSLLGGASTC